MSEPDQKLPTQIPEPEPSVAEAPTVQEALAGEDSAAAAAPVETAAAPPAEAPVATATPDEPVSEAPVTFKIPTRATTSVGDLATLPRPSSEAQLVAEVKSSETTEPTSMKPEAEQESVPIAEDSFRPGRVAFVALEESGPSNGPQEAERPALERAPTPFALDVAGDDLMDSMSTSGARSQPPQQETNPSFSAAEEAAPRTTNAAAFSSQYPDQYSMLDPDHPLMARVQEALQRQLEERNYKLETQAREKADLLKKTSGRRETIGVTLYQSQQQLARLQAVLDQSQGKYEEERSTREDAEQKSKKMSESHRKEMESLRDREERLEKQKSELAKIHRTIRQFDVYREDLESRISLTKRVTLKAEDDISKTEVAKTRQDFYIDQLNEQLRRLREQSALYEYQLQNQQKESDAAHATLKDANTEMEAISFEKKQLLNQWKSSLLALQRRDDMLRSLERATEMEQETMRGIAMEMSSCKRGLQASVERGELVKGTLQRLGSEMSYLEKQLETISENRDRLNESYSMYSKTLQQSEMDLTRAIQNRNKMQNALSQLHKAIHVLSSGTQKIELEIVKELQNQTGIEKQGVGAKRDGAKLKGLIEEKQTLISQLLNEISRVKVEALEVSGRNDQLQNQLESLEEQILRQNTVIEKFEVEIKRQTDELNKKQSEMDLLNRKYDQIMAHHAVVTGAVQGEIGPMEAMLHNLNKTIAEQEKQSMEIQQFWLKTQNDLVSVTKKVEDVREAIADSKMERTILERKKTLIDSQFGRENNDIKDLQRSVRKVEADMVKINMLLSKHSKVQLQLEENNLDLELEFRGRLKDAELETMHLEQNIDRLREEKKRALSDLVDAERQIMLWEKKTQIAKETQAALDPNVGASEIREMEQEIHRMKLRHSQLKKLQEKLILDIEFSIHRHGDISDKATKHKTGTVDRSNNSSLNATQHAIQKQIIDMTKRLKKTLTDMKEFDQNAARLMDDQQEITTQIQDTEHMCKKLDTRQQNLMGDLLQRLETRYVNLNNISSLQTRARRLLDLKNGKYAFVVKEPETRGNELVKHQERTKKIMAIARNLQADYGTVLSNTYRDIGLTGFLRDQASV